MNAGKRLDSRRLYEFGAFRLDPSERVFARDGERIPLAPKAFDTLLILVQHSGRVLSKDELIKTLWPDSFVEENNLTQHISALRRALAQEQDGQDYIETVPKLGYRFVCDVREVGEGSSASHRTDETEVVVSKRTRTRIVLREEREEEEIPDAEVEAVAQESQTTKNGPVRLRAPLATRTRLAFGLLCAAVLSALSYIAVTRWNARADPPQPRTIAVLPFRSLKPDSQYAFLSYSLADAINHRLGYFSGIVVRPSSYMAGYGDKDPRLVASELHVRSVLTGNYIKEGDRLRVSAELVDVAKAELLWQDTLDVPYDQLLTVQDRVADSVARGLQLRILPEEAERLKKSVPQNSLAYEYYLRGQDFGHANDYRNAIQMLEKSVALDATYASAWMTLGNAYANYANWQGGEPGYHQKSRAAFDKALQLEPGLPMIHTFIAAQMTEHGDLDGAVAALREELRLNPNEATAHWWMTEADLYGGMLQESIAEGEQALRLDPLVNGGSTFNSYLHAGEYAKFLATLPAGESARTTFYRGLCLLYMKQPAQAAEEFAQAYRLDPSLLHAKYGRALLYAIQQQRVEGLQYLKQVEKNNPTVDGEMLYKMGQAYALLGDKASAFRLLREAIDHSFYCYDCLARDPLLASLHGAPEYDELLRFAGERHEDFKRKYF